MMTEYYEQYTISNEDIKKIARETAKEIITRQLEPEKKIIFKLLKKHINYYAYVEISVEYFEKMFSETYPDRKLNFVKLKELEDLELISISDGMIKIC